MKKIIQVLAIISFCLIRTSIAASDSNQDTVFDISLHKPLNIPDCEKTDTGGSAISASKTICAISTDIIKKPCGIDDEEIYFPDNLKPEYIKGISIGVSSIDSNVESIAFATHGYDDQDVVLTELKKKFGKPSKLKLIPLENNFGRKVNSINAFWKKQNFTIEFKGIDSDDIEWGRVSIDSNTFTKADRACESAQEAQKKGL